MAAAEGRCGVDIQQVTPSVIKVHKKFAAPVELDILHSLTGSRPEASQLTLLWAAKEALKKAIGTSVLPGFLGVELCGAATETDTKLSKYFVFEFKLSDSVTGQAGNRYAVAALFYKEHVLAFTGMAEQNMV